MGAGQRPAHPGWVWARGPRTREGRWLGAEADGCGAPGREARLAGKGVETPGCAGLWPARSFNPSRLHMIGLPSRTSRHVGALQRILPQIPYGGMGWCWLHLSSVPGKSVKAHALVRMEVSAALMWGMSAGSARAVSMLEPLRQPNASVRLCACLQVVAQALGSMRGVGFSRSASPRLTSAVRTLGKLCSTRRAGSAPPAQSAVCETYQANRRASEQSATQRCARAASYAELP